MADHWITCISTCLWNASDIAFDRKETIHCTQYSSPAMSYCTQYTINLTCSRINVTTCNWRNRPFSLSLINKAFYYNSIIPEHLRVLASSPAMTWMTRPTRMRSISLNNLGSVRMNIARQTSTSWLRKRKHSDQR